MNNTRMPMICCILILLGVLAVFQGHSKVVRDSDAEEEQSQIAEDYILENNAEYELDRYEGTISNTMLGSEAQMLEVYEEVIRTHVAINADIYRGEGSIYRIEEDGIYIVSAKHLLQYAQEVSVTFDDGSTSVGQVVYLSEQYDFGFVKVELSDVEGLELQAVTIPEANFVTYGTYLVIASKKIPEEMDLLVCTVLDPSLFFPEFNSFLIHQYATVEPGMSGSGVFDETGAYVGMLVGGYEMESASLSYEYIEVEYIEYY
ncbi:MAG: serine protease [Eubacteriales bacterium]